MNHIGVGLIGTGYMGKCHALAWNAVTSVFGDVPRPNLVALCDVTQERARKFAAQFGFAKSTADWRTLLADPEIDVISITTPNQFHAEMAIAALDAGKHVWCEKPMATTLEDAEAMRAAARKSGKVALLGYNYIQNPAIAHARKLIGDGAIGAITHLRIEMDEDFMADPDAPFSLRDGASSGHGALDDFGVHAFSLIWSLCGGVARVLGDMARPYADRPADSGRRAVETHDIANVLMRLDNGASAVVALNRSAWGRKGRIFVQAFGSKGSLVYDQERLNELLLFTADGAAETRGFRAILSGPAHPPFDRFMPAPGHQLGFNDLKVIEARALLGRLRGEATHAITFEEGIGIERSVDAVARSVRDGAWVEVGR
jgi:predicted dehydrogenase